MTIRQFRGIPVRVADVLIDGSPPSRLERILAAHGVSLVRWVVFTLALTACTSATAPPEEPSDFSRCLIGHATDTLPYRLVDPVRMDTLRYHCPDLLR